MFDPQKKIDWSLILVAVGLISLGLVALYSTSQAGVNYFSSQIKWMVLGGLVMLFVAFLPNRFLYAISYPVYMVGIGLLILVLFWGHTGYGATRWLRIGPIGFQPSEFAKIGTLLAVARFLTDEREDINHIKPFSIVVGLILLPFLLIARQPDLGTALVFLVIALPILYWAGLRPTYIALILIPGVVMIASFNIIIFSLVLTGVALYLYILKPSVLRSISYFVMNILIGFRTPAIWNQLKDYQKQRILTFWNPESDPLGAGYQIIQSKVAIGSGGLFGKGFLHGSQTQLRFLPEQHTDFIYAVIGEEFGFFGVLVGLVMFAVLLSRMVHIASILRNPFGSIITIGIATILAFHMFVNIGMTIGLFPVTGLPLPFVSYGGSAMITNMVMIGMVLNFYRHRFEY